MANNILLLQNLPRFRGNLRSHETDSITPSINVRTFFRSIENYFDNNNIIDNEQRIRILFEMIDKTSGDAIDLVNCYAGRNVIYEEVRENFLQMYPEFRRTEFRHAAFNLLNLKIAEPSFFCGMTRLENATRAIAEAYINRECMSDLSINLETNLNLGVDADIEISCQNMIQNFLMQYILATQLDSKVYDKIAKITPDVSSTTFMSKTVQIAEKDKLFKQEGIKSRNHGKSESSEVLYKVDAKEERVCRGCKKAGHLKQNCPISNLIFCKFCKIRGHETLKCRNRISNNVKYCTKCKRLGHEYNKCRTRKCTECGKTGHDATNCWSKDKKEQSGNSTNNTQSRDNVRAVNDLEDPNYESGEDTKDEH